MLPRRCQRFGNAPSYRTGRSQVGDEYPVRERAEGGSPLPLGERTSRPHLPLSEPLKGLEILLTG